METGRAVGTKKRGKGVLSGKVASEIIPSDHQIWLGEETVTILCKEERFLGRENGLEAERQSLVCVLGWLEGGVPGHEGGQADRDPITKGLE